MATRHLQLFYSFLLTCAYKFLKCGAVPYKKNLSSSSASSAAWQRALFGSFSSAALLGAAVFHSKLQGNLFSAAICIFRKPSFSSFYAVLRVNTRPIYRYTLLICSAYLLFATRAIFAVSSGIFWPHSQISCVFVHCSVPHCP